MRFLMSEVPRYRGTSLIEEAFGPTRCGRPPTALWACFLLGGERVCVCVCERERVRECECV